MSFLLLRQPARSNVLIRSTRHLRPGGSPTCGTAISDRSSFVLASRHQQHTSTRKMPENRAAWLVAHKQYPLVVKDAPYTEPGPDEVAIRVAYAAMNPADWKIVKWGYRVSTFPMVIGQDVSGEVVQVGKNVSHVAAGDRVVAHVMAVVTENPAEGAFQLYTIAQKACVAPIPDSVKYENAAVLPLAVSTATVGLFTPKQLALPLPKVKPTPSGQVVLVWGGSSSVGSIAIQLAKLAGYKIAATCSPRNNEYVRSLGAEYIFDYSSKTIVDDVVKGLEGQEVAGVFNAIGGEESGSAAAQIISKVKTPTGRRHVATVPPLPANVPEGVTVEGLGSAATMFQDDRKEIAAYIWQTFLPEALATGALKAVPEPLIVGEGLDKVQLALDTLEAGVSAKKVLVKLS